MKILIVRTSPDMVGGAELSAFDQAVVLKDLGHEPVFGTNLKELKKRAEKKDVKTVWFPWTNRGPGKLRLVLFFLSLPFLYLLALAVVLRTRPDIINPHSREDQIVFTFGKIFHKKPVIWKDPGDSRVQVVAAKENFAKNLYRKIYMRAIRRADYIYLLNEQDLKNLVNVMGGALQPKLSAIPASILYKNYDLKQAPLPRPKDKLVVGSLARLEEEKGVQYLIKATKALDKNTVECWIANDGAYKENLEILAGEAENIKFLPYSNDVSAFFNSLDIFVHPAEAESWGRVIKEAMYFGLPIVSSDTVGGKAQIADGETGLIFESKNVNSLTSSLNKLINDAPLRKRLGRNAKQQAEKDGDFGKIVKERILPIYERSLEKSR